MREKLLAFVTAIALSACVYQSRSPVLCSYDKKEYYVGPASSECEIVVCKSDETFRKLFGVSGECARGLTAGEARATVEGFGAREVFSERAGGVVSYYFYSERIPWHKSINGEKINLHIVFDGSCYTIGTPLVFGWY